MWLRLRQIALIARDIEPVVDDLKAVFGLEVGHVDPGVGVYGLENRLLPVGHQFIEIVSPIREGTTGGRYLERRNGDGGYMVICQAEQHPPVLKRVEELGIRDVGHRTTDRYSFLQLHPQDTRGTFLEIDWHAGGDESVPPWEHAAGDHWQPAIRTGVVSAIAAAEIQSADPVALGSRWSEILQLPSVTGADGNPRIDLDGASLRFVPATDGRPEGLGGVDLVATDAARAREAATARGLLDGDVITICGTRFRLV